MFIFSVKFIETVDMSTVQVDEDVKRELFEVAAELQLKLGRKVPLNETIKTLIDAYRGKERDKSKILSLYGSLEPTPKARNLLKNLREEEDKTLETAGKHHS